MKYLIEMIDRIFAVCGALLCSQVPLFIKQYTLRLGGHVTELRLHVNALSHSAEDSNKTLTEYIQKFLSNTDPDIYKQGEFMQGILERLQHLSYSLSSLENCSVFTKPFLFFYHLNPTIMKDALGTFQPGIIFSTETLFYSLFGILLGCSIFRMIRICVTPFYSKSIIN